jgi:hypothetical protein
MCVFVCLVCNRSLPIASTPTQTQDVPKTLESSDGIFDLFH